MASRHYELMIILAPDLEERTIAPSLEQYLTVIRTAGGSIEKLDVWGRRRLAYEIDKNFEGIYALLDLRAESDAVRELDRQLKLNESVLRTKLIRLEDKPARGSADAPTRGSADAPSRGSADAPTRGSADPPSRGSAAAA